MSAKLYLNLLVLFGVLCQGIFGTLSEKEIDESSDLLVRQKRVINRLPGGDIREPIERFPYVVAIRQSRLKKFCAGVILTYHTVLTVARCVAHQLSYYKVYAGGERVSRHAHFQMHNITNRLIHIGDHQFRPSDGIALITVVPSFLYSEKIHNIELYQGPVQPGFHGVVPGWGCSPTGDPGTAYPEWLRSITVPIISTEDCNILYLEHFRVSDTDICTLDAFGHQYCDVNDAGSPLVFHMGGVDKVVGLHLWNGGIVGRSNPDVFVNLQHPIYKAWIEESITSLERHLSNPVVRLPFNPLIHESQGHLHNVPHQGNFP